MSKSDSNENAFIALLDSPDAIRRKIKRAVTDSDGEIRFGEDKPGVSNLLSILSAVSGKAISDIEKEMAGLGYGALKEAVAEAVVSELEPLQKRYAEIRSDKEYLNGIISENAEKAYYAARKTLGKVQKKIGFAPKKL